MAELPGIAPRWTDIDGWLSQAEGDVLLTLSAFKSVLEFGSYKGRSTVCMALSAQCVVSVDWHQGDSGTGPGSTLPEFLANIERFGVKDKIIPIVARIEDAVLSPDYADFDLAFIDDDHAAEAVERSTKLAMRYVKPGGYLVWHDYDRPSVRDGVAACGLEPTGFRDTLAWMKRP